MYGRSMWCSDWCWRPWDRIQGTDTSLSHTLWWHLEMIGLAGSSGGQRDQRSLLGIGRSIFRRVRFHNYQAGHRIGGISSHLGRGERTKGRMGTQDTKLLTTNFVSTLTKSWMSKFPILNQETQVSVAVLHLILTIKWKEFVSSGFARILQN